MTDFGLQIEPAYGFTYDDVASLSDRCKEYGYDSIWVSDHFMLNPDDADRNCMDCWTLLSALAASTSGINIGPLVSCVTYRNPAMLAKIAATVDMVSGGRLIFGLGAGWNEAEHKAYGIPFPGPRERVDRLYEALEIITNLWTQPKTTFQGQHYSVTDAVAAPKPVQKPHPPILVGGSRPRVLRAAARYADIINMGSGQSPESYAQNLQELESLCKQEGTDFSRIRKTHLMTFVIASTSSELDEVVARVARQAGRTPQEFVQNKGFSFIGTTSQAIDTIRGYGDAGVTQFMTRFPFGEEERSMRLFADHIIGRV